jgi:hypothetical protein
MSKEPATTHDQESKLMGENQKLAVGLEWRKGMNKRLIRARFIMRRMKGRLRF